MKYSFCATALLFLGTTFASVSCLANTMVYKSEAPSPTYNDPLALTIYTPSSQQGQPYPGAITHLEMALIGEHKQLFITTYFTHQLSHCNPDFKQTMTFHVSHAEGEVALPFEAHCELPTATTGDYQSAVIARPSTEQAHQYLIDQLLSQPSLVITHRPDGERNTRTTTVIEVATDGFTSDWNILAKAI